MQLLSFVSKKLATQEKVTGCFCFSTTITHGTHAVFEIMTKFVFIKVMNCKRSLVSNLTPTGSCIENNDLWFKEKKFFSIDLNCLTDSASRMLSNLFHSLTQKGEERMLKAFSTAGKFL